MCWSLQHTRSRCFSARTWTTFLQLQKNLIEHNGAIKVQDGTELGIQAARLLSDAQLRESMGENAFQAVAENAGALQKSMDVIKKNIERQGVQNYPITTS
jgi:3-deoxy-D-manno-octulosonic-acid transferase